MRTDLSGSYFRLARMHKVDLSDTILENCLWFKSDFSQANFKDANLSHSQINGCKFTEANLENAQFVNCNLAETSFIKANLRGANFTGADIRTTLFTEADLTNAAWVNGVRVRSFLSGYVDNPWIAVQLTSNQWELVIGDEIVKFSADSLKEAEHILYFMTCT